MHSAILKDKFITATFAACLLVLAASFVMAYVSLADTEGLLVIHFDSYKGVDFFGQKSDVFNILYIGGIVWAVNAALAYALYSRERILSYFIALATVLFTVLLFAGVNVIISIN